MNDIIYDLIRNLLRTDEGKEIIIKAIEDHCDLPSLDLGLTSRKTINIEFRRIK